MKIMHIYDDLCRLSNILRIKTILNLNIVNRCVENTQIEAGFSRGVSDYMSKR